MAISRFATSSVAQGLPKYQKLWDQSTVYVPPSFESISTYVVGSGGASGITFSSIPSTYKHLQIRLTANGTNTNFGGIGVRFNGDSANNYYGHYMWTYGSGVSVGPTTGVFGEYSTMVIYYDQGVVDSNPIGGIIDILDYNNTNKYKTIRSMAGRESNGSGQLWYSSGLWKSGSAVNSLSLTIGSGGFTQDTKVALYGIRG